MKKITWVGPYLAEALLVVFSLALFAFALYIIGPWFVSYLAGLSPISAGVSARSAQIAIGSFFLISSMIGLSIPFIRDSKIRLQVSKYAGVFCFLSFFFLAILRIIVFGWTPLTWIYPVTMALASATIRLYLEVRGK